ncbi:hypothetical protein CMV_030251 [Castanea mollissima]|uniref:Uncharacterized protein n=1 Tax=Castanea mollissima TaxID=60419 RepID=A0A8J4Q501_9ROSI|nr:hypothetical protein CMV_030251 [Castanea mollissima]
MPPYCSKALASIPSDEDALAFQLISRQVRSTWHDLWSDRQLDLWKIVNAYKYTSVLRKGWMRWNFTEAESNVNDLVAEYQHYEDASSVCC